MRHPVVNAISFEFSFRGTVYWSHTKHENDNLSIGFYDVIIGFSIRVLFVVYVSVL